MSEKPHVLHVSEDFEPDEPGDSFELEHHPDCPTERLEFDGVVAVSYLCQVGELDYLEGLSVFFRHSADTSEEDGRETLTPGTHLIEPWGRTWRNYTGAEEWEGGLSLVKAEGGAS